MQLYHGELQESMMLLSMHASEMYYLFYDVTFSLFSYSLLSQIQIRWVFNLKH